MRKYPVKVKLTKLLTREDAPFPQEHQYPSLTTVRIGFMWEHTKPIVGKPFMLYLSKINPTFHTSTITEIVELDTKTYVLTTLNSKYKLEITS